MRLLVLLLCTALPLAAQVIERVIIRAPAGQSVSEAVVRSNMRLAEGQQFSPELLSRDLKSLYASGHFADIEARDEAAGPGKINLILTITPKPRITSIVFMGNERIKTKKLEAKLTQKANEVLQDKLLANDLAELYKLYQEKGYHEVVIRQNLQPGERAGELQLQYLIEEPSRYKTRDLEFVGNTVLSNFKLRMIMDTGVSWWGYLFPTGYFNDETLQLDLDKVREEYWNRGYLDFAVTDVAKQQNADKSKLFLTITMVEGQPYTVGTVKLSGNTAMTSDELLRADLLQPGTPYSKEAETKVQEAISARYNNLGYLHNRVIVDRLPDPTTHLVALNFTIVEGTVSTVRNINISGNRVTHDNVIRRELQILPDDLADGTKIRASRDRLMNLGYFRTAEITDLSTDEEGKVDLQVKVEEQDTGRLMLGAGFSSADNLVGQVEFGQSNFDLFGDNSWRGAGQRFRVRANVGSNRQDYVISFTEPWLFDTPLRLDVDAWKRTVGSNRDWEEERLGTGVTFTKKMAIPFWRQSYGYKVELVEVNDIEDDFSQAFKDAEADDATVSAFTLGFTRDKRDNAMLPNSGTLLRLGGEVQSEGIGAYADLYKLSLRGSYYLPLFKASVLRFSSEVASVDGLGSDEPRVFDRHFAGGMNSVRGFKERSIGPVDPGNGEVIGGKSELSLTAEYTTPIYEKTLFYALFVDAGNVWADAFEYRPGEVNVGVGMGLRIRLPIGAFMLDYGWPIVREQEDVSTGGRLHFNLGYSF